MSILRKKRSLPKLGPPTLSPRQKVIAAWRGIDLSAQEKLANTKAKTSASVTRSVLKSLNLEKRQSETEILNVWNALIDPLITAHAQPTGVHNGTLFVSIDSPVWRDEIVRYRSREILDRLQHSFGKQLIQRVSYRIGG